MTAELPPPLADLAAQYDQLADAAESGHIAHADALAALAALGVVDAAGQVWGLNAEGEFTCAEYPGAPAVPADPTMFTLEYLEPEPTPPGPWGPAPGDAHDGDQQGPSVTPHGMPAPSWGAAWGTDGDDEDLGDLLTPPQVPAGGRPAAFDSGFDAGPAIRPRMGRSVHDADRPNGLAARLRRALPQGISSKLPAGSSVWQNNKALLIVLAAGAVLLILLMWHSNSGPSTALPSGTAPVAGDPAMPVDAGQTAKAQHTALPTADDATRVTSALSSGQRATAAGVLATTVDTPTIANLTAYFYGAAKTGLDIGAGPAAAEGSGAVQQWTVSDHDTHVKVRTITVHWVFSGTAWKLSGPPGI